MSKLLNSNQRRSATVTLRNFEIRLRQALALLDEKTKAAFFTTKPRVFLIVNRPPSGRPAHGLRKLITARPDCIEQLFQGRIKRQFLNIHPGGANLGQFLQVGFEWARGENPGGRVIFSL